MGDSLGRRIETGRRGYYQPAPAIAEGLAEHRLPAPVVGGGHSQSAPASTGRHRGNGAAAGTGADSRRRRAVEMFSAEPDLPTLKGNLQHLGKLLGSEAKAKNCLLGIKKGPKSKKGWSIKPQASQ